MWSSHYNSRFRCTPRYLDTSIVSGKLTAGPHSESKECFEKFMKWFPWGQSQYTDHVTTRCSVTSNIILTGQLGKLYPETITYWGDPSNQDEWHCDASVTWELLERAAPQTAGGAANTDTSGIIVTESCAVRLWKRRWRILPLQRFSITAPRSASEKV